MLRSNTVALDIEAYTTPLNVDDLSFERTSESKLSLLSNISCKQILAFPASLTTLSLSLLRAKQQEC
jgi:hypothetical protein